MKKVVIKTIACVSALASAHASDAEPSINDLEFLIGEWSGEATLSYPREPAREARRETVNVICDYTLKQSHIQCDSAWQRASGETRTFRLYLNYNALDGQFEKLFLYDNWPRRTAYPFDYDAEGGVISATTTFEEADGVTGEERILWTLDEDRTKIRGEESNRLETDPSDQWLQTFEFVWRKSSSD